MADQRRIRVLLNPGAGEKLGFSTNPATAEHVLELMERYGLGSELVVTESFEHGQQAAVEAVEAGYDIVAAAGGDGTVGAIGKVLLGTETALGVLPLGSVMNIARMLGIPRELEGAAEVIATGVPVHIDVGEVKGEIFYEGAFVGLNAALFQEVNEERGITAGNFLEAIKTLFRYKASRLTIQLDSRTIKTRALMVTISNGPYIAIGSNIAPAARLDDGRFDVAVFHGFSRWAILYHLAATAFGRRHYAPSIRSYRSGRVAIDSRRPVPCWADATDLGTTPITFQVRPRALKVMVPAATAALEGLQAPGANEVPGSVKGQRTEV